MNLLKDAFQVHTLSKSVNTVYPYSYLVYGLFTESESFVFLPANLFGNLSHLICWLHRGDLSLPVG